MFKKPDFRQVCPKCAPFSKNNCLICVFEESPILDGSSISYNDDLRIIRCQPSLSQMSAIYVRMGAPVQIFIRDSVVLESICYHTRANRLKNESNMTVALKKIRRLETKESSVSYLLQYIGTFFTPFDRLKITSVLRVFLIFSTAFMNSLFISFYFIFGVSLLLTNFVLFLVDICKRPGRT